MSQPETELKLSELNAYDGQADALRVQVSGLMDAIRIWSDQPDFVCKFAQLTDKPYYAVVGKLIYKADSLPQLAYAMSQAAVQLRDEGLASERERHVP